MTFTEKTIEDEESSQEWWEGELMRIINNLERAISNTQKEPVIIPQGFKDTIYSLMSFTVTTALAKQKEEILKAVDKIEVITPQPIYPQKELAWLQGLTDYSKAFREAIEKV